MTTALQSHFEQREADLAKRHGAVEARQRVEKEKEFCNKGLSTGQAALAASMRDPNKQAAPLNRQDVSQRRKELEAKGVSPAMAKTIAGMKLAK